ncbi:MAG: hypothetical protein QXN56_01380 [Candidatus Hadarchaeum sp.]
MARATGERLVSCAMCGEEVGVTGAAYRRVKFLQHAVSNYLSSSIPDQRFWSGADLLQQPLARGMFADRRRTSVGDDNVVRVVSGIRCFEGSCTVSHQPIVLGPGDYVFAAYLSHHEHHLDAAIASAAVIVNAGGNVFARGTEAAFGQFQLWVPFSVATFGTEVIPSISVVTDFLWFFESARIQMGTMPGPLVENVGGPVFVPRGITSTVAVVCGRCVEIDPESSEAAPNQDAPSVKEYPDLGEEFGD